MLTFETLSRIAREEKASANLTKLPEGFFGAAASYLSKKGQASEGKEDAWELDNARMVLGDLEKAREKKLFLAALNFADTGVEPQNMAPEEREFFEGAVSLVATFRSGKKRSEAESSHGLIFLEDVPQFVGTDLKEYGPFKGGDEAELPEDLSRVLVERGAARPKQPI